MPNKKTGVQWQHFLRYRYDTFIYILIEIQYGFVDSIQIWEERYHGVYLSKGQNITTIFLVGQADFFRTIIPSPKHFVFSVTIQKTLQWLLGKMEMNMHEYSL